jgi:hypothetical protein
MGHSDQHQLVHQVYHLGAGHEFLFERFYPQRKSRTVHQECAFRRSVAHDLLDVALEVALEQTVSLVQHEELAVVKQSVVSFDEIFESARRADHHLNVFVLNFVVVFLDHGAPNEELNIDLGELADLLGQGLHLQSQLPSRHHDNTLNVLRVFVDFVEEGDQEGPRLACPVFGPSDYALAGHNHGNALLLDGSRYEVAALSEG